MRFIRLYIIGFCLLLTNCKSDKVSEVKEETPEQKEAGTISQKDIEGFRYEDFQLSADSRKGTIDWQKYQELNTQIDLLKKADLSFFSGDLLLLKTFLAELRTEMPEPLQTNEINARITALDTKAQKLNSLLTISNMSKEERLQGIKEFLITVSNLNLQINKKYEFDKNNVFKPQ